MLNVIHIVVNNRLAKMRGESGDFGLAKVRKPGRPKLTGSSAPEKMLGIRASKGLVRRLDKWRSAQGDKLTQSEAARRLMEAALTVAGY
jgi:hypothetical protein